VIVSRGDEMTDGRLVKARFPAFVLVFIAAASGCGDKPFPFDTGGGDLPADISPEVAISDLAIRFTTPAPESRPVVSGIYQVVFDYSDPEGKPATLTAGFYKHPEIQPYVIQADGPGTYSINVDTTLVEDGNRSVEIIALSSDGRTVSKNGKILVDNNRPEIEILEPTPAAGAGFVDDLSFRVRVTDSGSKVHFVRVTIGQFTWEWIPQDGEPAAEVDTRIVEDAAKGIYIDVVVPTEGWRGADLVMKVVARDGVAGRDAVVEHPLVFVERPGLDGGERVFLPLVENDALESVEGIRLGPADDGDWAVLGRVRKKVGYELVLFQRSTPGHAVQVGTVLAEECQIHKIFDMNIDGMDDILAWCGLGASRRIVVFLQGADRAFVAADSYPTEHMVKDLAAGDLNRDTFPDIAFVSDVQPLWTGIMLSITDQYGDFLGYGPPSFYSGAVRPTHVAIGRFSDDQNNAVVVGASGSGLVTAYPIDESGVPSMGENSSLDPDNLLIDDVSDMVAVNFGKTSQDNDALVVVDSRNVEVLGVARLRQDASRRVESVHEWPTGAMPTDIAAGDIDVDGAPDIAVLCGGSNMVDVFMGVREGGYYEPVSDGRPLLVGSATDVTLADMDFDGYLDVVALTGKREMKVVYYRKSAAGGWMAGSRQALVPAAPISLAVGHFVEPLSGTRAGFLDAAVLYMLPDNRGPALTVASAEAVSGQPVSFAGELLLSPKYPTGLVAGNFDIDLNGGGATSLTRLDDLIVTSDDTISPQNPHTAWAILFQEAGHNSAVAQTVGIFVDKSPMYAAVGDFDPGVGGKAAMDVAFMWHLLDGEYRNWLVQPMLGAGDGTFSNISEQAGLLGAVPVGELNRPFGLKAFAMRRSLKRYLEEDPSSPDLMVLNKLTRDVTILLSMGFGMFRPKELGSLDHAVGGQPVDIAAGYLRTRLDDNLDEAEADSRLPDLVTLLTRHVLVSYSLDKSAQDVAGSEVAFEAPVALESPAKAPVATAIVDINVDGIADILVLDGFSSSLVVFPGLGQRRFAPPYVYPVGTDPIAMVVADVDDDGCPDVVTADRKGRTISTLHNRTLACPGQEVRP